MMPCACASRSERHICSAIETARATSSGPSLATKLIERGARDQLHRDEVEVAVAAVVVDRDGVATLEPRQDRGFLEEAAVELAVDVARVEHLERDRAAERNLLRLEDLAHPALADQRMDAVATAERQPDQGIELTLAVESRSLRHVAGQRGSPAQRWKNCPDWRCEQAACRAPHGPGPAAARIVQFPAEPQVRCATMRDVGGLRFAACMIFALLVGLWRYRARSEATAGTAAEGRAGTAAACGALGLRAALVFGMQRAAARSVSVRHLSIGLRCSSMSAMASMPRLPSAVRSSRPKERLHATRSVQSAKRSRRASAVPSRGASSSSGPTARWSPTRRARTRRAPKRALRRSPSVRSRVYMARSQSAWSCCMSGAAKPGDQVAIQREPR